MGATTAHKHYKTYTNLCSTIKSTLETYYNLSAVIDLQHTDYFVEGLPPPMPVGFNKNFMPAEPLIILARTLTIPFDHTAMAEKGYFTTAIQPYRTKS